MARMLLWQQTSEKDVPFSINDISGNDMSALSSRLLALLIECEV